MGVTGRAVWMGRNRSKDTLKFEENRYNRKDQVWKRVKGSDEVVFILKTGSYHQVILVSYIHPP